MVGSGARDGFGAILVCLLHELMHRLDRPEAPDMLTAIRIERRLCGFLLGQMLSPDLAVEAALDYRSVRTLGIATRKVPDSSSAPTASSPATRRCTAIPSSDRCVSTLA
jgi:hypothetical protein